MVLGVTLFWGLFNNLAIFVVLIAIYGFINNLFTNDKAILRQVVLGVTFGAIALVCMQVKIPGSQGVFVDQRNAIVILGGTFGGPVTAFIAAIVAAVYRIHLGGIGVLGGCLGLTLSAIAGTIIHNNRHKINTVWKAAAWSGCAVIFILPGFLPIGSLENGLRILREMAVPYGSAIFLGILLPGLLLTVEERRYSMKSQLSESEKRYRELFESLIDVSFRTDISHVITIISPSCEKMFGYRPAEMIGTSVLKYCKDPSIANQLLELLHKNGIVENFEAQVCGKDQECFWVSINAKVLHDKENNNAGVEGSVRDISQMKKALEDKAQILDNLRQVQKMESIGTLAGGIAHDFNNSLSGIAGGAELLLESGLSDEERNQYVNLILTAAERAAELTKKLLAFSRKGSRESQPVDVCIVINDSVAILRRTIDKKVMVTMENKVPHAWIMGDDALLQNVFLNLGINAWHAMPDGGTLVFTIDTVDLSEEYCEFSTFDITSGRFAEITVQDSGCGMTPEIMQRIFEPFFTTKPQGKGTGLGLAAVYGTIQDHHGAITVYSEVGTGTVFHVYLPLTTQEAVPEGSETPLPHGSGTILIIDDEELVRITASAILSRLGYEVLIAQSGRAGITTLKEHKDTIGLVILDMIMPVMGGREVFREIREFDPAVPVVIASGYSREGDMETLRQQGAAGFLRKPFSKAELAEMVARVIREKK